MSMKKILVTGSAGFIGSHVFDQLCEQGHDVYGIDDLSGGFLRNVSKKEKFSELDLRDRKKVEKYISDLKPEIIFHLAADATEGRSQFTPFSAVDRNLVAYMNLLVPAIKNGLEKMILTSSMSVYGAQQTPFQEDMITQPEDIYGISKASMEQSTKVMANVYGFKYVIIRPHNVYGRRQNLSDPYRNVVGIFINRLLQEKNFYIYGDGEQKRAFSHIDDVAPIMVEMAFSQKCENKIINLGSEEPSTLNELSKIILEEFFGSSEIPEKFKSEHLPDRPQEVKYAYCEHEVARELLNFKPRVNLREGIKDMIEWAKEVGSQEFHYLSKLELDHPDVPKTWKDKLI